MTEAFQINGIINSLLFCTYNLARGVHIWGDNICGNVLADFGKYSTIAASKCSCPKVSLNLPSFKKNQPRPLLLYLSNTDVYVTQIRATLSFLPIFFFTTVFVDTRLWKTKHSRKRFQKFPSIIRVIDMSDRNPPITATDPLRHASGLWLVDFDPTCR